MTPSASDLPSDSLSAPALDAAAVKADPLAPPVHIAFIMDGNGRWAQKRGKPRTAGHTEGLKAAKRIIKKAADLGVRYVTLYAFSTENWKRTQEEVGFLMQLIRRHLKNEMNFYRENQIRVRFAGNPEPLPPAIQTEINEVVHDTAAFTGMTVVLAINYGGKDEILRAVAKAARAEPDRLPFLTEADLRRYLDNPDIPDPDFIVRTAGEERLSNFLTWESAYSELIFSSQLWPDYNEADLIDAIHTYQHRTRKFGGLS